MAKALRIEGTYTAIVTPFQGDASLAIDWKAVDALVESQIEGGVDGLVPCGTTGESPALSPDEQLDLIKRVVERARGRVLVVAGTGTNSTRETIERSQAAERAGADAVMIVVPYYSKPTQEGLTRHFIAAAAAVSCPVIIYNIPGRTGIDLLPDALAKICDAAKNVIAVKEATGNVLRAQELVRRFGERLAVMSGDDALTLPIIAVGGRGVISVTSNLLPKAVARAARLALDGKFAEAKAAHLALLPLHEVMFLESNPGPVKAALAMKATAGVLRSAGEHWTMSDAVRGPLVPATEATRRAIQAALDAYERRE